MSARINHIIKKIKYFRLLGPMRSALLDPPVWTPYLITLSDGLLHIEGFAFPPRNGCTNTSFTVNGKRFENIENRVPSSDAGERYFFIKGSEQIGFKCSTSYSREERAADEHLVLQYVDGDTGQPFSEKSNYYYPLEDTMPVPSPARRVRVHGNDSAEHFFLEGYSTFVKLRKALNEYAGRDITGFPRVLDWGCGCGRVGRYFGRFQGIRFTGIDIDADNISWCKENMPFGTYEQVPLHPPTRLQGEDFDLLFGISIFTHLKEKEQFEWLAELSRLAAPGAIVLMTVHGGVAAARASLKLFRKYSASGGFMDFGSDPSLKGYIDDEDYYRSTFHTHDYIRSEWSKYFDIITIIPGYIGNNQDLVVMRKR